MVDRVREISPDGIDLIVEVAPTKNAEIDEAITAIQASIAVYGMDGPQLSVPLVSSISNNLHYHFFVLYTVGKEALDAGKADINAALAAGALRVGEDAGLPVHRYPLPGTAAAHDAVEAGTVGKVLIDIAEGPGR